MSAGDAPGSTSDPAGKIRIAKRRDVVHLAVPKVSRHVHRKLRILTIRDDVSLKQLVVDLIESHPRVVAIDDEFTRKTGG